MLQHRVAALRRADVISRSAQLVSNACLITAIILLLANANSLYSVTFAGTNTGAIPDGVGSQTCGAPRDINFAVIGISYTIGSTRASFTASPAHTWVGDLRVSLIAPNGAAHLLFSRVGSTSAIPLGDDSDLGGNYLFADTAVSNFWTAAAAVGSSAVVAPGLFRTQVAGPGPNASPGPAFTNMNSVFSGLPPASRNGTWTLRFEDCAAQDTGAISAASLILVGPTAASAPISGRLITKAGAGIYNAEVELSGGTFSEPVVARTGAFGYYRFENVPAGLPYILTVRSKRFFFGASPLVVTANEELSNVDFVGEPY